MMMVGLMLLLPGKLLQFRIFVWFVFMYCQLSGRLTEPATSLRKGRGIVYCSSIEEETTKKTCKVDLGLAQSTFRLIKKSAKNLAQNADFIMSQKCSIFPTVLTA